MSKLKTKKVVSDFRGQLIQILEGNGVVVERENEEKFMVAMQTFFETYKPDNKTEHWNALVLQYFSYFEWLTGRKPAFMSAEPKALKEVSKVLHTIYCKRNPNCEWDEKTALERHKAFYDSATSIQWYKQNFSISNLHHNFDKIVAQLSAQRRMNG